MSGKYETRLGSDIRTAVPDVGDAGASRRDLTGRSIVAVIR